MQQDAAIKKCSNQEFSALDEVCHANSRYFRMIHVELCLQQLYARSIELETTRLEHECTLCWDSE
jgi:hypothetical protein